MAYLNLKCAYNTLEKCVVKLLNEIRVPGLLEICLQSRIFKAVGSVIVAVGYFFTDDHYNHKQSIVFSY